MGDGQLFLASCIFAQNYYELTSEATKLYNYKDYNLATKKWDMAFNIHDGFANNYYNAACSHSLAENKNKAIEYLRKAIDKGWIDIDWLKEDSDFAELQTTGQWKELINDIPIIQEKRLDRLNLELKDRLESLRMQDQVIRLLLPDTEKGFGRDSKEYNWFRHELMPRNDSVVLKGIQKNN